MRINSSRLLIALLGLCLSQADAQTNSAPSPDNNSTKVLADDAKAEAMAQRHPPLAVFNFAGGNAVDFVNAAQSQLKVDWAEIATIPKEMFLYTSLPKLRVPIQKPEELLKLYNSLSDQNPAMGKWVWEGPAGAPIVLMLVPPGQKAPATNSSVPPEPPVDVQVFYLAWISGTNLATAADALKSVDEVAQRNARQAGQNPVPGRVVVDERTGSIIVSGPRDFLTMSSNMLMRMDVPSERAGRPMFPANRNVQLNRQVETVVFHLQWASGATVANALKGADAAAQTEDQQGGKSPIPTYITLDDQTGSVIVTGSHGFLTQAKALVKEMDAPPRDKASAPSAAGQPKPSDAK